jgi:TetR/AcrR family transcriptional regulator, cholesterol catabolism regulator
VASQQAIATQLPREQELLDIAARTFRRKGYHGTSMSDIAAEMGILGGSLYHYFPSKEDLLYRISLEAFDAGATALQESMAQPGSADQRLAHVLRGHVLTVARNVDVIGTCLMEARSLQPQRAREIRERAGEYVRPVRRLIIEGQTAGVLRAFDPRVVSLSALGMGNWVARWYRHNDWRSAEDLAGIFSEIAVRGLATAEGAAHPSATSPVPADLVRVARLRWRDGERRDKEALMLSTATELFAQRGYHGTSLQAIADRMGALKGSIFNYVSGKEELLFRIIDTTLGQAERRQEQLMQVADPLLRLRAAMIVHVNYMAANRAALTVMLLEIGGLGDELRLRILDRTRHYRRLIEVSLAEGRQRGLLKDLDPHIATLGVIGCLNWTHTWLRSARASQPSAAEMISDMLLRGLAAPAV